MTWITPFELYPLSIQRHTKIKLNPFKKSEVLLIKAEQAQATKYLCIFPKKKLFKYKHLSLLPDPPNKAIEATTILH